MQHQRAIRARCKVICCTIAHAHPPSQGRSSPVSPTGARAAAAIDANDPHTLAVQRQLKLTIGLLARNRYEMPSLMHWLTYPAQLTKTCDNLAHQRDVCAQPSASPRCGIELRLGRPMAWPTPCVRLSRRFRAGIATINSFGQRRHHDRIGQRPGV